MNWSSEFPTEPGFYWFRNRDDMKPVIVRIEITERFGTREAHIYKPGDETDLASMAAAEDASDGDYAGPLMPPE